MQDANTEKTKSPTADLPSAAVLAATLERLDRSPRGADADQYRIVVERLQAALSTLAGEPALKSLLARFPAAAEVYENLQYAHAGLCLHDLDRALRAESMARDLLDRIRRPA